MSIFNYKEQPGYLSRLKEAIRATKRELTDKIDDTLGRETEINEDLLEQLEQILISTDIGVETSSRIIEKLRAGATSQQGRNIREIKKLIRSELLTILESAQ